MIRLIFVLLTVILYLILTIPVLPVLWIIGKLNKETQQRCSIKMVRAALWLISRLAGMKLTVEGRENIPEDRSVLYVGNHRSYFDIVTGYLATSGLLGFVAKKEMINIPLLSTWMKLLNCLFLDRENIKEGLKTILTGIEKVKSGVSMWIFPEGTRNEAPLTELMDFKEGSLKIAEKSGCPVVPVAMIGTAEVLEAHFPLIRSSKVVIRFGQPFYVKELEPAQKKFAGAYTRSLIIGMLEDMEKQQIN